MELNEKIIKFNKNELPLIIAKQQELVNNLEKKITEKSKKKDIHIFALESYRLMSLLLEKTDTDVMTQNPEDEDPTTYNIIKKTNPHNWIITDGINDYKIKRGSNGIFKLNKKDIYCYVPKNEGGV